MWRNVVHICLLFCPLQALEWIDESGSTGREGEDEAHSIEGRNHPQICPEETYFDSVHRVCAVTNVITCQKDDLKADPEDCKGYFQCIKGDYVKLQCANGSYFNSTIKTCVVDVQGNCDGTCTESSLTENPDDCAQYYECIGGKFVQIKCPSGSYFNANLDSCVIDENGICSTSSLKKFK
ncbi:chitin-binding domain protein cbd-1-like [Drosophila willistoni]|uniref:chitin-binding domain protein cbd-1-like n=1 Tax=Drosophila willistoni TaxID=7260 RepID=UPI001F0764A4|nr:chitin-binding domain protein cbd-1-like [Drosophila willistoni]